MDIAVSDFSKSTGTHVYMSSLDNLQTTFVTFHIDLHDYKINVHPALVPPPIYVYDTCRACLQIVQSSFYTIPTAFQAFMRQLIKGELLSCFSVTFVVGIYTVPI